LGDLEISETTTSASLAAAVGGDRAQSSGELNFVRIQQGDFLTGKHLSSADSGRVMTPHANGLGYDCAMAMQIKAAVADVLKDGKLDPQEADRMKEMISNTPNPAGKRKSCGPSTSI
jgi:hypothetical protein